MTHQDIRWLHAIWCDDIRLEIGNKPSFMGTYTTELVPEAVPSTMPKLCVWVEVATPKTQPFKLLKLKVIRNDLENAIVEQIIDVSDMEQAIANSISSDTSMTSVKCNCGFVLINQELTSNSKWFQVIAETEGETIKSPRLAINTSALKA